MGHTRGWHRTVASPRSPCLRSLTPETDTSHHGYQRIDVDPYELRKPGQTQPQTIWPDMACRRSVGSSGPATVPVKLRVVQQRSTATSWTASGSERLLSVAHLPQRPPATSPPRVRIEGVGGSNLLSSTLSPIRVKRPVGPGTAIRSLVQGPPPKPAAGR